MVFTHMQLYDLLHLESTTGSYSSAAVVLLPGHWKVLEIEISSTFEKGNKNWLFQLIKT